MMDAVMMSARPMGPAVRLSVPSPAARVLGTVIASVAIALLSQPETACLALGLSLITLACSRPQCSWVLRRLLAVNGFILFLWLTVPWSVPGQEILPLGPLRVTREGLLLALMVTLKSNAMVLLFMACVGSLSMPQLGAALERLRCPARLTLLVLVSYRYLAVLHNEWQRLRTSASLRGFVPGTNARTYKTYAMLLGMLFVRAHDRSHRIWEAMQLRGFNGRFPVMAETGSCRMDLFFVTTFALVFASLVFFDLHPELLHV